MFDVKSTGSFDNTESWLKRIAKGSVFDELETFARAGTDALAQATPVESGLTAESWTYEVKRKDGQYSIEWHNTNVVDGVPVAILIQYGHGTTGGTWVEGRDYINPVIRPLFDEIVNGVLKGVTDE